MRSAAIVITVFSAHLWAAGIWNAATDTMSRPGGEMLTGGAVMTGVIASLMWKTLADARRSGESLGLLAQTVADTTRPAAGAGSLRSVK